MIASIRDNLNHFTVMAKREPGAFTELVLSHGVPVLWATGVDSRRQIGKMIATIIRSCQKVPTCEQKSVFDVTIKAIDHLNQQAMEAPDEYVTMIENSPAGWPVILPANAKEVPDIPDVINILSHRENGFFDIMKPRRGGTPDASGKNKVTGVLFALALHLWGAKKLLTFDSPTPEALRRRVDLAMEKWPWNSRKTFEHFMLTKKSAFLVPETKSPQKAITLLWNLLIFEIGNPERIIEFRKIVKAPPPLYEGDEKNIATDILHELRRSFAFIKMVHRCSKPHK